MRLKLAIYFEAVLLCENNPAIPLQFDLSYYSATAACLGKTRRLQIFT